MMEVNILPKNTFFNLSEEKKEKIINAALDEFSEVPFEQSSIANIIKGAKIPRGSFYQYFENKKDIYSYIIELGGKIKIGYMKHIFDHLDSKDFFQNYRDIYEAGFRYAKENPKYAKIGELFFTSSNDELKEELFKANKNKANDFMKMLLYKAIEKGEIRKDTDVDFAAEILYNMSIHIVEKYITELVGEDREKFLELVDKFIEFLRHGFA